MSIIIPYIYIVGTAILLSIALRKKFDGVLPLSVILLTFCTTVFSLFGKLRIGIAAYALIVLGLAVVRIVRSKIRIKEMIELVITPGLVFFTLMFVFVGYYHRYTDFTRWDEWSHWGQMVRDMYNTDTLFNISESYIGAHKEYPSFVPMFETIYCILSREFKESYIYRGISVLSIVFFVPIFNDFNIKKISVKNIIVFILASVSVLLVNIPSFCSGELTESFLTTIYTDFFLSIISAYSLYCVIKTDKFDTYNCFYLAIIFSALLMSKQMSIAFLAICYFVLVVRCFLEKTKPNLCMVLILLIPLAAYFIHSQFINSLGINSQFNLSDISFETLYEIVIKGIGPDYKVNAVGQFMDQLLNVPMISSPIPMTYLAVNIIITIVLFVFLRKNRKLSVLVSLAYTIGYFGYAFTMLTLYMFSFSESEVARLASFYRYMGTYLAYGLCLLVMLGVGQEESGKRFLTVLITFVLVLSIAYPNLSSLKPASASNSYRSDYTNSEMYSQFEEYVKEGDKVLILSQYQDLFTTLKLNYLYPNIDFKTISLGDISITENSETLNIEAEEWIEIYSEYDYFYTYNVNSQFLDNYWYTTQSEDFLNNRLYKVEDGTLVLMPWISGAQ